MTDLSSFTTKFRAYKSGSHESSAKKVTKRMAASACNQCQKSKLRCDRSQPCGSCIKRCEEAACTYERAMGSKFDGSRNAVAEDRLQHLEIMVKQLMQDQVASQPRNYSVSEEFGVPPEGPPVEVDGHPCEHAENTTRYVGSTHWSAILDDIHELKSVLGGSAGVPIEDEPLLLQGHARRGELIFASSHDYSLERIISQYLPPKVEVDRFLSMYFRGEAYIVPFVHTYHFQKQYREFWADTTNVNPLWLSMLFSMCYMASLTGCNSVSETIAQEYLVKQRSVLHTAAAKCLVLGGYHLPQLYTVEALAMYGHCKNLGVLNPSREVGAILGIAVRLSYEMGYHRDPDSFGNFTVFEGEMRRRFWAAIKQMDLMISFMLGLPSNVCLENCDTRSPRNLLDSEFDADTKVLPPSRSENEPTRMLWFIVKERQMASFSKVCQDALSFKEKSEAEIIQLDIEIREMNTTIPGVLRTRPLSESIADPPFLIMTRIYVEFIHLKSICVLHRKYMARGNAFSTRSCVEAGTRIVSQFIEMCDEFIPGGQLCNERWMLSNFTMNDFLLGVMVLCLVVHTRWKRGSQNAVIDSGMESKVLALLEQAHAICVVKSPFSRDAKRVSHAVRLTLNGAKASSMSDNPASQTSLQSGLAPLTLEPTVSEAQGVDPASLLLPSWQGYAQNDEAAFGLLDPFNFMGNDIENMDWTMFDP